MCDPIRLIKPIKLNTFKCAYTVFTMLIVFIMCIMFNLARRTWIRHF